MLSTLQSNKNPSIIHCHALDLWYKIAIFFFVTSPRIRTPDNFNKNNVNLMAWNAVISKSYYTGFSDDVFKNDLIMISPDIRSPVL
jgi:hypothetical protein